MLSCFLALLITTCFIFRYRSELLNFKMCITNEHVFTGRQGMGGGWLGSALSPLLPPSVLPFPCYTSTSLLIAGMLQPSCFPSTPQILLTSAQLQCHLYMQSFLILQSWHCPLPALYMQNLLSGPLMGPSHTWL